MLMPIVVDTAPQSNQIVIVKRYEGEQFPLPFHMHQKYELTLIVNGTGTRIICDDIDNFEPGDIVFMGPLVPHQWQSSFNGSTPKVEAITVFLEANFPTPDFRGLPEFKRFREILDLTKRGIQFKGDLKKKVSDRITSLLSLEDMELTIAIFDLLKDMIHSKEYDLLSSEHFIIHQNLDTDRISVITEYIYNNLRNKISLAELASLVSLHPGSLSRMFRQSTGYSIVEYINRIRIGLACKLLDETNEPIINIAFDCGYQNLSHFNRFFKKAKQATPSQYRASRRSRFE
jgi:AraC-like DNA-binding protein/mannose-6-phosphate isomerase-like protein (cupin superfamily)